MELVMPLKIPIRLSENHFPIQNSDVKNW